MCLSVIQKLQENNSIPYTVRNKKVYHHFSINFQNSSGDTLCKICNK